MNLLLSDSILLILRVKATYCISMNLHNFFSEKKKKTLAIIITTVTKLENTMMYNP